MNMALNKNDLEAIEQIVDKRVGKSETYLKDYVEFAIEKSEKKLDGRFDKIDGRFDKIEVDIKEIDRNIEDMIETDREFLDHLGDHEKRIIHVEKKLGIKPT